MKNTILIALFLAGSLFSCTDVLDEELTGGLTANGIYSTPEGLELAVNASYSTLTKMMGNKFDGAIPQWEQQFENGWGMLTYGTDIYRGGNTSGMKPFATYSANLNPSHGQIAFVWGYLYRGINAANVVTSRAPNVVTDPDQFASLVGQARFLRGYYYFWMARMWGPVHYTDQETIGSETEATRMPLDQLYPKIIADLEYAEQNLPSSDLSGRATSWAAKSTLADVYLTLKDYDKAAQYAEDVINNGPFSLVRPYADLWKLDNQENEEVNWVAPFSNVLEQDNGGNGAHMFFLSNYTQVDGMIRDVENGKPWQRFRPLDYLYNLYDDDDERFDATFKTVWYANDASSAPPGVQVGDTALWFPKNPISQVEKDMRPFPSC